MNAPEGRWTHKHGSSQRLAGIRRLGRSSRRSQLACLQDSLTRNPAPRHALRVSRPTSKPSRPHSVVEYSTTNNKGGVSLFKRLKYALGLAHYGPEVNRTSRFPRPYRNAKPPSSELTLQSAAGVPFAAASHGLFQWRACHAAFCLWQGQSRVWRDHVSSRAPAAPACSLCAQLRP